MRLATGVLVWVVAAAAATAVGLAAVAAIGTDIFGGGQDPLSQSEVDDLLTSLTTTPPTTPPSTAQTTAPTTSSTPAGPQPYKTATEGGTVTARCTPDGLVEVMSRTPAQGFSVASDDSEDGLDDHPSVKFRSGDRKIEVRLRCVDGVPRPTIKEDD
jgi:hypothetical protein